MPRIEIYDASNTAYRIDTFDWTRVRDWLAEWAPRLRDPDYPLRMSIRPLFRYDPEVVADWNADTRFFDWFEIPPDPDAIMARIEEQRQRIERAKAEGRKYLSEVS
jgi:hypothetical protein